MSEKLINLIKSIIYKKQYLVILITILLLTACNGKVMLYMNKNPISSNNSTISSTKIELKDSSDKTVLSTPAPPPPPFLTQKSEPYILINQTPGTLPDHNNLIFNFTNPYSLTSTHDSLLTTQALTCTDVAYLKISVSGINISPPLYPSGVDGFNMIAETDCDFSGATVPNVPYGNARVGTGIAYDTSRTQLGGMELKAVFNVSANPTTVEMSYKTTPAGKVVEGIIADPKPLLASTMNLTNLQTLINNITGVGGVFPNYTYTTHPTLVDTDKIKADLIANGGNSTALDNAGYYPTVRIAPATVTGTISGLVDTDLTQVKITDPASAILNNQANGAISITPVTAPKTGNTSWQVKLTPNDGTNGTTYTVSPVNVSVSSGNTTNAGTITFTPATPSISSLSSILAPIGTSIDINGDNFYKTSASGNVVKFGTVTVPTVDITFVNKTKLTVKVPAGISGTVAVTVKVGTQTSNSTNFTVQVAPTITSFTPTGAGKDTSVTITGTSFTGTTAVKFNGVNAGSFTVNNDTQISATVPNNAGTGAISITNPAGTGNSTLHFAYKKWEFVTGGAVKSSPAIGSDGTIYVGSDDNKLYAINPDGTQKWAFYTGNCVKSSPTIGSDGTIYVGSDDKKLYAINPNGTQKWTFSTGDTISSSPAIGSDGTVYVGSNDFNLYAINPNGTQKWTFTTTNKIHSSPAIGSNGTIYVGSEDRKLYAIKPDGTQKWAYTTDDFIHSSPAISSDDTIYVGNAEKKVYAINPDGTQKWIFITTTPMELLLSSPSIGSDGTIYIGSYFSRFYAINPDGTQKWAFPTAGIIFHASSLIGFDGTIYIGSEDRKLYAINPDGTQKWAYTTDNVVDSSPVIAPDGTIYFGSTDNKLYAISSASTGLADTPWPKFHADNKNTGLLNKLFISSFTPTGGPAGTSVTIYGNNFTGATSVKINGMNASSFNVDSNTKITATVPSTTSGLISVTTPSGTATSLTNFNIPPIINSLSVSNGTIGSSIQINGIGFSSNPLNNTVKFGTAIATVTNTTTTQLTVTVPDNISGSAGVTVEVASQVSNSSNFEIVPTISSFNPNQEYSGSNIQINGTGFSSTPSYNTVKFDTTGASVTAASYTQLTVTVPYGIVIGTNSVTVKVGNQTSNGMNFIVKDDRIVYLSYNGINIMNSDGSGRMSISADGTTPAWSPDKSKIAFASNRDGNWEIYVMNANGSNQTRLTNNSANDSQPAWSPDGTKIAFTSNRDENYYTEIYVMNANGSNQTRLTYNYGNNSNYSTWSPDGTKIAFHRISVNYQNDIYTINSNGTNQTQITFSGGYSPNWSPDGSKIAFGYGGTGICTINPDGTGQIGLGGGTNPSWSPNGKKIAFAIVSGGGFDNEIFTRNKDGSGLSQITNNNDEDVLPCWH